ncbi:MAG: hypothetical protein H7Z40_11295 [Phycisphaerae bacterium]|nr:hypothetical protein [Gemmatimonadaceae bacterium]
MSINGISNPLLTNIGPLSRPDETSRSQTDRNRAVTQNTIAPAATPALKPQAPIAGQLAQHAVPAEAPAGTDPTLWSVLTSEERNFFAKTASLGPLTYGRIKASMPAAPPSVRGGRLDVRA